MKNISIILCHIIFFPTFIIHAQDNIATLLPERPKPGDSLTITYHPNAQGAKLKDADSIVAELLFYQPDDNAVMHELPMKKIGSVWSASAILDDNKSTNLFLQFSSGDDVDDNNKDAWTEMVYGSDGKPVKDAQNVRARALARMNEYGYEKIMDIDSAMIALNAELSAYPDNMRAHSTRFSILLNGNPDSKNKEILRDLNETYERFKNAEGVEPALIGFYTILRKPERDHALLVKMRSKYLHDKSAKKIRRSVLYYEMSDPEQWPFFRGDAEAYLKDFPDDGIAQEYLTDFRVKFGENEKAFAVLNRLPHPDGTVYTEVARDDIERGIDLNSAVRLAKKGIDLIRKRDAGGKQCYESSREWRHHKDEDLVEALSVCAYGLAKMGRTKEALTLFEEAYDEMNVASTAWRHRFHYSFDVAYFMTNGPDSTFTKRYMSCLLAEKKYDEALTLGFECVRNSEESENILYFARTAHEKLFGSSAGFEAKVSALHDSLMEHRPVIDFTLKRSDGTYLTLSELRGKIVALDFWGTRCGACKAALPMTQKVYEKFKDTQDVAFLVVDVPESLEFGKRVQLVRNITDASRCTFPLYFDVNAAKRYGVTAIPTTFVLGRDGKVRSTIVGFDDEELTKQIEVLLDEKNGVKEN